MRKKMPWQKGEFENATLRFQEALELNKLNDKAWVGLALVHKNKVDVPLAWSAIQRALDINPLNVTALRIIIEWGLESESYSVPINYLKLHLHQHLLQQ